MPAVNQIELHPSFQQADLTAYAAERGIAIESYSPLGQGQDLTGSVVRDLAKRHGKSPAQVVLRWHFQRGFLVIPKSTTTQRIRENIDIFDFSLDDDEIASITGLEAGCESVATPLPSITRRFRSAQRASGSPPPARGLPDGRTPGQVLQGHPGETSHCFLPDSEQSEQILAVAATCVDFPLNC